MRILMLAHRIPYPPHTGDKVRAYHVARHLARRHAVTLGCVVDEPADLVGVDRLAAEVGQIEFVRRRRAWGMVKGTIGLLGAVPVSLSYFGSRDLRARVNRILDGNHHDLIYVSSSPMAQYVIERRDAPLIMDFVDVDSDKWAQYAVQVSPPLRWLYRFEGERLRRYEGRVAARAVRCLLATRAEADLLRSFAPWAQTTVVPNGIDLTEFSVVAEPGGEPVVMFTGAMDYLPNIDAVTWFCESILPTVRDRVPGVRFLIVGLKPAPAVLQLGRRPGVTVTGAVPDVRPYYAQATVAVAPLRIARGVQNKVLQAMAMGVPVVATSRAGQGLDAEPGTHLLVEDEPAAFARAVVALLRQREMRRELARRGRAFVEAHHGWPAALAELDRVIESVRGEPDSLRARVGS
jgi:sugar transferase (PEP-CTERM/EpsH1 system associated)